MAIGPYIESLRLKNVRCFEDGELNFSIPDSNEPLSNVTLLVGENGSGKTTVLQAIEAVFKTWSNEMVMSQPSAVPLKRYFDEPVSSSAELKFANGKTWKIALPMDSKSYRKKDKDAAITDEDGILLSFTYRNKGQYNTARFGWLQDDEFSHRLEEIQELLLKHLPREFFRTTPIVRTAFDKEGDPILGDLVWATLGTGVGVPFNHNKGGCDLVMEQVSMLLQGLADIAPEPNTPLISIPGTFMIDGIETKLHPANQTSVLPLLSAMFPRVQFIVVTYSPIVMQSVPSDAIVQFELHMDKNAVTATIVQ